MTIILQIGKLRYSKEICLILFSLCHFIYLLYILNSVTSKKLFAVISVPTRDGDSGPIGPESLLFNQRAQKGKNNVAQQFCT